MTLKPKEWYTSKEAAEILQLDQSRILQLCRAKRLGQSSEKHGKLWVITHAEIEEFKRIGALPAGRPRKTE